MATWYQKNIPQDLLSLYDVHEAHHASAILVRDFPVIFAELCEALSGFRISEENIKKAGGNESEIPRLFSARLRTHGWQPEAKLIARLVVDDEEASSDTHKIDYVNDRVAVDFEWNSKDQTFDRDLYAMRAFFDFNRISVGVIVTRSSALEAYFRTLGTYTDGHGTVRKYADKFGQSTTHMNKLISRLRARRHGGCPILAFGITEQLITKHGSAPA